MKAFLRIAYITLTFTVMLMAPTSQANDFVPGVIYDVGTKMDKSFNEAAYNGLQLFIKESGVKTILEGEIKSAETRADTIRNIAKQGATHIVVAGFTLADPVNEVAQEFPETRFTIIDAVVEQPNVQSILFKEHEGSYMVGLLAGMATESNKIGFIGGMDISLIHSFGCGFKQGVAAANKDAVVSYAMIGDTPAAWNNPEKAAELAGQKLADGADVIYAAAGGSGRGAGKATTDAGKFFIGVDINQNHLWPGLVLSSMLKRVDVATYSAFKSSLLGGWHSGVLSLGVADGGISWAYDEHNEDIITDDMLDAMDQAKLELTGGAIKVHDYRSDNSCPL